MDKNELFRSMRLFLFDMDGTLYLGDELFPFTKPLLKAIRGCGATYLFMTNNSSKSVEDYVKKLARLGIDADREDFITSSQATAYYLHRHYEGKTLYVCGTESLKEELRREVFALTEDLEKVEVVVTGFDTELVYEKLNKAVHFLRRGAAFIEANPDWVCPMPNDEVLPDCGSICALLTAASGVEPVVIGKPNRNMVDIISNMTGVPNEQICCVGDRLYTDIAVAQNAGAVSLLVMSGETTPKMLEEAERKPDYVLKDVKQLMEVLIDGKL